LPQHLKAFSSFFRVGTRSVASAAETYLLGLFASPKSNMLSMSERMLEADHQVLHHMLSDSKWDFDGLVSETSRQVNTLIGGMKAALIIDESAVAKKGEASAGVARQWNGRLGKVENSQVGVFAALAKETAVSLIDARLYLPGCWLNDTARLDAVEVPTSARVAQSKVELAREMIFGARRHGVRFGHVAFDAVYGSAGWLLRELDDEGIPFMGEVRCDQHLFLQDPTPSVPRRTSTMGRPPSLLRTEARAITVSEWLKAQPASAWRRIVLRGGEKGFITIEALSACVWLWDGQEDHARRWHLFMRREIDRPDTVKFALSNAKADTSLHQLASMQAARFWIEHAFREAKDCLGMAQYQVRKWNGWHHHMALVMLAMNFLLKEQLAHRVAVKDLTLSDLVFAIDALLPHRAHDPDSVAELIAERHQRRRSARDSAYRKQNAALLNPSAE
jgi:SRSO17 transposase